MISTVTVFTTPTCRTCRETKYLLAEKGVQFREVDVSGRMTNATRLLAQTLDMGVPVVDIGGALIVGFDREWLEETSSTD